MKDLIKDNKEAIDFVIHTLNRNIQELAFQLSINEDQIKDIERSKEDTQQRIEMLMKEIAVTKYCKGLVESSRDKF